MITNSFIDNNKKVLIIQHRKSAVYFLKPVDPFKRNSYGPVHQEYICITELKATYEFSEATLSELLHYLQEVAAFAWPTFNPRPADSRGADYDDYYDKEFDNNGSLSLYNGKISIEGPYTQLCEGTDTARLIKFNKRKFESFIYDLDKMTSKLQANYEEDQKL